MRSYALTHAGLRLARWFDRRKVAAAGFWAMVVAGPVLAIATFAVLSEMEWLRGSDVLRPVLLLDFVYAMIVAAFLVRRIVDMIAARRRKSAGSKLHMRLTRFFTAIALIPNDSRRRLCDDHAQRRFGGLVFGPRAQRRGELDGGRTGL